jgi:hypothetical protein
VSIYATWLHLAADEEHEAGCTRWVPSAHKADDFGWKMLTPDGKTWDYDPSQDCSCGELGPLVYHGSHINPTLNGARGGYLEVGAIPDHCHPDTRDGGDPAPVEFLRIGIGEHPSTYHGMQPGDATVVLDRHHVERLRDTLTQWLDVDERG